MNMYVCNNIGSDGLVQQVNKTAAVKLQFVFKRSRRYIYM